jgi:rRNA maturation RNase YbeY
MQDYASYFTPVDLGLPARQYEVQSSASELVTLAIAHEQLACLALWVMSKFSVSEPAELSLSFVDSSMIRALNLEHRGLDKATDVLSFSADFDEGEASAVGQPLTLGDIVICPEISDRIDYGADIRFERKMEILVIHGILHLLGYDHEAAEDANEMEAIEDELLSQWVTFSNERTGELVAAVITTPNRSVGDIDSSDDDGDVGGEFESAQDDSSIRAASKAGNANDDLGDNYPGNIGDVAKNSSLIQSFGWAIEGIVATVRSERNMKIHLVIAVLVVIAGFVVKLNISTWAIIIICIALVFAGEMTNTAIENLVDLASPELHPKAKLAKDISAGMVLVLAIGSVAIGLIVFIPAIQARLSLP